MSERGDNLGAIVRNLHDIVNQLDRSINDNTGPPLHDVRRRGNAIIADDSSDVDDEEGSSLGGFIDDGPVADPDSTASESEADENETQNISVVTLSESSASEDDIPVRQPRQRRRAVQPPPPVEEEAGSASDPDVDAPLVQVHPRNQTRVTRSSVNASNQPSTSHTIAPVISHPSPSSSGQPSTSNPSTSRTHAHPSSSSDSDDDVISRRPKRRRVLEVHSQIEEEGVAASPVAADVVHDDDEADEGCPICYEDFTNAGEHRLVSLKCGHFFGKDCIERWIRGEGRASTCPTCKGKATLKDVRLHFANSVKLTDTSELEALRVKNAEFVRKITQLEMDCARKERDLEMLRRNPMLSRGPVTQPSVVRAGNMIMLPRLKKPLCRETNGSTLSRAFDFNGHFFAIGVQCRVGSVFKPYGVMRVDWSESTNELVLKNTFPLHLNRSRVVVFSPYENSLVLSGGEDKLAIVHEIGSQAVRRQWNMRDDKQVWCGCWTSPTTVALGLNNGRVLEYDIESDSSEPVKDYTQGIGNVPIMFVAFDRTSSVLLVGSFKKMIAFLGDRVFPLLSSSDNAFDSLRSVAWDERTISFVATFTPGGRHPCISHRLYKLEIGDDQVSCSELSTWNTSCIKSTTLWTNCLFSLDNTMFSVVYNEDQRKLEAHDWSGKRSNVLLPISSSQNVCAIKSLSSSVQNCRSVIVLTESNLYYVNFKLID